MNSRNLIITSQETGSPRSGYRHGQVLVRAIFWVTDYTFSLYSHIVERKNKFPVFLLRALIPFMRAPPWRPHLILITFQGPHLLISLHWGVVFQNMNSGGT